MTHTSNILCNVDIEIEFAKRVRASMLSQSAGDSIGNLILIDAIDGNRHPRPLVAMVKTLPLHAIARKRR